MSTVITIIADHLRAIGADGLVCTPGECACMLPRLAPCDGIINECKPGWRGAGADADGGFVLYPSAAAAEASNKEGGAA